ncbi:MAG: 16S rRNA (cytosine(1402)-N(4))-methyltransferase RsmH [Bacteroidales bacterium]|nr:16S rRNA (cytosine(1402)-N(4))-methyltransferase RsmH [Bacteroidales bacterium]
MAYHIPVLLKESIEGLNIKPDGVYIDLTFGGGGHSREILKHLDKGKIIAFDCDVEAEKNIINDQRFTFINQNFRFFKNYLRYYNYATVDGIIADLGVSSQHFDSPERGFSYRYNSTLDMRMDQSSSFSAFELVNGYNEEQLANIFYQYAEFPNAYKIAKAIINARETEKIRTTNELVASLKNFYSQKSEYKFLSRIFQAIRIEVNKEIEYLEQMLIQVPGALNKKGRFVIVTYHSLEDRRVKNFIKKGGLNDIQQLDLYENRRSQLKLINKKVITPCDEEIMNNKRARSAKLRIAEKI